MRLLAPAKLNLHLRVGPPRTDGFHPLMSWFVTAGLFDTLTFASVGKENEIPADSAPVTLTCNWRDIPCDDRNLIVRVLSAWAQEAKNIPAAEVCPLSIALHKEIPAGAGLGGGSSDGARALIGANELWKSGASMAQLAEFAGNFGSDLPFFFHGPSSICTGRGENVTPIAPPRPRWAVIYLPNIVMPTPQVYRRFDQMNLGSERDVSEQPDWKAWSELDSTELLPLLVNDLEAPAFSISDDLRVLRELIEACVHQPVRMSGSGSSLFTLFDDPEEARRATTNFVFGCGNLRAIAVEVAPQVGWHSTPHSLAERIRRKIETE